MALDERLRRELEQAGRPADPHGVYEHLIRRKERRRLARTVRIGALGLAVVIGSAVGFLALNRVFEPKSPQIAAPEPSNGAIIFAAGDYPNYDLYRIESDGTGLTNLTSTPQVEDVNPGVSPDGTQVAFCRFENGESHGIWVMGVDGTLLTQLTDGDDCSPAWSPDGTQLVFERTLGDASDLMVVSLDGSNPRRVVPGPGAGGASPAWSPTGEWIAFNGPVDGSDGRDTAIYLVRPDGTDLATIGNGPGLDLFPAWSPDGRRIAFVTDRFVSDPESSPPVVAVMNADGSNVHQLTVSGDAYSEREPFWSPDGDRIGFIRSGEGGGIYTMAVDGSDMTLVSSAEELSLHCCPHPTWQPIWETGSPSPVADESPTMEPSPLPSEPPSGVGEDIGLGFPVCRVSSIEGPFVDPNETATAFVATRMGDLDGCPDVREAFNVIALDLDADGIADSSYGPIECEMDCRTFSAPDLDGDGTAELLVVQTGGVVLGLGLFDVQFDEAGPALEPVIVAPPGDPAAGFDPGEDVRLWLGGDEFYVDTLECGDPQMRNGPGLIVTRAESLPHDSPDAEWHAHRVVFALVDGALRVMDLGDFTEPIGTSFPSGETLCGSNLGP